MTGARVSCVLPACNEADSLARTVAEWADALAALTRDYEIVVVDDGSTDHTAAVLRDLTARFDRLRVITHQRNLGYGVAITNGFTQAAFPLVFFTDSDGQYEPRDFGLLLERLRDADVVVGYRMRRADTLLRRLLSAGYNALARKVIGVTLRDINCAFKLMHQDTFLRLGIEATGFIFNAEMAVNARDAGMTIVEVPVRHRSRYAGRSSVRLFHVATSLYQLAQLRVRRRRVAAPGYRHRGAA